MDKVLDFGPARNPARVALAAQRYAKYDRLIMFFLVCRLKYSVNVCSSNYFLSKNHFNLLI